MSSNEDDQYEILPSSDLLERMMKLAQDYPTFVTLTTTQEWFGLPRAGTDADCTFDTNYKGETNAGCNNYVLIIQDKEAYPDDPDVQLAPNAEYLLNLEGGYWKQPFNDEETPSKSGWRYIPDVFLSGSVHGDERVGPTSLIEMASLLVESAYCESLPRMRYHPKSPQNNNNIDDESQKNHDETLWSQELMSSQMCRTSLLSKGIPPPYRQWLARLASTRRIVIIPTANALGYSQNVREENRIDPNRDFPFDIQKGDEGQCMQTIAGRSINELFRSHLFPIGLTFHGGMEVIGYEWGAPTYLNKDAPDAVAQNMIAEGYSRYANGFPHHKAYDYGTMNDKVYYVRGGMEDWAFAGSWDPERVVQCAPTTYGGYDAEKTTYNNSTLRAFNMLIETSDIKGPPRDQLGKRTQPLISSSGEENGHIARNIRLALLAVDAVEPYVSINGVEGIQFEDDHVPAVNQRNYDGTSYFETSKQILLPEMADRKLLHGRRTEAKTATVSWTVGGSFDIDSTEIVYGPWEELPSNLAEGKDGFYPSPETSELIASNFLTVSPTNTDASAEVQGRSMWHKQGAYPKKDDSTPFPTFETTLDLSSYPSGTKIAVVAKVKVDKAWTNPASNVGPPGLGSVSHIVNARTNPAYHATNAGKVIQGRDNSWWYSKPVSLIIGSAGEYANLMSEATSSNAPMTMMDGKVKAIHINARTGSMDMQGDGMNMKGEMDVKRESSVAENSGGSKSMATASSNLSMPWLLGALASFSVFVLGCVLIRRKRRMRAHRRNMERIRDEDEDFNADFSEHGEYRDDSGIENSRFGAHDEFTID
ncbi:hypothetical protein ACHAXN_007366 [Cyclotella atomus]